MQRQWTSEDGAIRVGMCQRRTADRRSYRFLMNFVGNCLDFAISPLELKQIATQLVNSLHMESQPHYIVGLASGAIPITIAVSYEIGVPAVIAYKSRSNLPGEISWSEPHCIDETLYLYGLEKGMSILLLDEEVDSGRTLCNSVIALRSAGIEIVDVGSVIEVIHNGVAVGRERLSKLNLHLKSVMRVEMQSEPGLFSEHS